MVFLGGVELLLVFFSPHTHTRVSDRRYTKDALLDPLTSCWSSFLQVSKGYCISTQGFFFLNEDFSTFACQRVPLITWKSLHGQEAI